MLATGVPVSSRWIIDSDQAETLCWCGIGESGGSEFHELGEGVDRNFALGMASDCRSKNADHFIEESLAGECKDGRRSDGLDIDRVNGACCGVWGGIPLCGEGCKIMGSAEE